MSSLDSGPAADKEHNRIPHWGCRPRGKQRTTKHRNSSNTNIVAVACRLAELSVFQTYRASGPGDQLPPYFISSVSRGPISAGWLYVDVGCGVCIAQNELRIDAEGKTWCPAQLAWLV